MIQPDKHGAEVPDDLIEAMVRAYTSSIHINSSIMPLLIPAMRRAISAAAQHGYTLQKVRDSNLNSLQDDLSLAISLDKINSEIVQDLLKKYSLKTDK